MPTGDFPQRHKLRITLPVFFRTALSNNAARKIRQTLAVKPGWIYL